MVHILLISPKGNMGSRYFPHHGYLGLTPITVQGSVCTRIDSDGKPLSAKSLTVAVRCYETRHGLRGAGNSNIIAEYPQLLWQAPPTADSAPLADFEASFRITVPRDAPGHSTAYYQDYRVFWRVEVVINHPHIPGVGNRLIKSAELIFYRHDLPSSPPTSPVLPHPAAYLPHRTTKPRAPVLQYQLSIPSDPVGPLDLVSIGLSVRPVDPTVSVRSASLVVERRIEIRDTPALSPPPPMSPTHSSASPDPSLPPTPSFMNTLSPSLLSPPTSPTLPVPASAGYPSNSSLTVNTLHSSASSHTIGTVSTATSQTPLLRRTSFSPTISPHASPSPAPDAAILAVYTHTVAGTESSSGRFVRDPKTGVWARTLTLQWPAPRSSTRWAIGETMRTEMASVTFWVKVKVIVTGPAGTDSLDLHEQALRVATTNTADRQLALSKYHASLVPSASIPPPPQTAASARDRRRESEATGKRIKHRASARPHTSSGPARPHTSAGPGGAAAQGGLGAGVWRPGTAAAASPSPSAELEPRYALHTTRLDTTTGLTTVAPLTAMADVAHVRAWEEELARIERESRKSSRLMRMGAALRVG